MSRSDRRSDAQASLLTNSSLDEVSRTKRSPLKAGEASRAIRSQEGDPRTDGSPDPDAESSRLFDQALQDARIETGEAAYLCGVTDSLVRRWRSSNYREQPSLGQLLRLPPSFHIALHRQMDKRYGFGRAALASLLDAAGALALFVR